jgi:DNA invertase Pin-like site-specific DNA recombinase
VQIEEQAISRGDNLNLRCAIYSRFSSDRQSAVSIEDQIRKCREYASRQGWVVLEEHVYADHAITGTSAERTGLQRLLAAAEQKVRVFDAILIDDTSRLTRKLADALNFYERLTFAGVRLVAVSQGVDSESSQAEILFGVHGLIDSVYSRELGLKTHRGMQGCALKALHTGGRVFGYRSVRDGDGVKLEIVEQQAATIRRMFELYSTGYSLKRIAYLLNAEGVKSPQPQKGRVSQSWCVSSVRHILKNRRYKGQIIWNTKRKVRVPATGRRIYRRRPESEWVVTAAPDLQIVSDELFAAVERRFVTTQKLWGIGGQQKQVYLFSGLLRCGECGGSITLVGGRAKTSRSEYGCSLHAQRGDSVCTNGLRIQRQHLEARLLSGLRDKVLREEFIDYVICGLQEDIRQRHETFEAGLKALRDEKHRIEAELKRLVEMIAVGNGSPTVMTAIAEREARLREITNQVIEPGRGSIQEKLEELRTLAISRLTRLRGLLANPSAIHEARALLAEQVGKFTLERVSEGADISFKADAGIDFFGSEALHAWVVPGAGIAP